MKKLFFIVLIIAPILLMECRQGSGYASEKAVFQINNHDPAQFGYEQGNGPAATATSICLDSNYAYIADAFHNNVKKINLTTFEITHSAKLPGLNPMPMDICLFNNKVYVTSLYDSIYVLDKNLNLLVSLYIDGEFEKNFVEISDDTLVVYLDIGSKIVKIDKYNRIHPGIDTSLIDSYATLHGKRYALDTASGKFIIETDHFSIELREPLPNVNRMYDAHDIEYDDHHLVLFGVDTSRFILYVYELK